MVKLLILIVLLSLSGCHSTQQGKIKVKVPSEVNISKSQFYLASLQGMPIFKKGASKKAVLHHLAKASRKVFLTEEDRILAKGRWVSLGSGAVIKAKSSDFVYYFQDDMLESGPLEIVDYSYRNNNKKVCASTDDSAVKPIVRFGVFSKNFKGDYALDEQTSTVARNIEDSDKRYGFDVLICDEKVHKIQYRERFPSPISKLTGALSRAFVSGDRKMLISQVRFFRKGYQVGWTRDKSDPIGRHSLEIIIDDDYVFSMEYLIE